MSQSYFKEDDNSLTKEEQDALKTAFESPANVNTFSAEGLPQSVKKEKRTIKATKDFSMVKGAASLSRIKYLVNRYFAGIIPEEDFIYYKVNGRYFAVTMHGQDTQIVVSKSHIRYRYYKDGEKYASHITIKYSKTPAPVLHLNWEGADPGPAKDNNDILVAFCFGFVGEDVNECLECVRIGNHAGDDKVWLNNTRVLLCHIFYNKTRFNDDARFDMDDLREDPTEVWPSSIYSFFKEQESRLLGECPELLTDPPMRSDIKQPEKEHTVVLVEAAPTIPRVSEIPIVKLPHRFKPEYEESTPVPPAKYLSKLTDEFKYYSDALKFAKKIGLEDNKREFGKAESCPLSLFVGLYSWTYSADVATQYTFTKDDDRIDYLADFLSTQDCDLTSLNQAIKCMSPYDSGYRLLRCFSYEHDRVKRNSVSSLGRSLLLYLYSQKRKEAADTPNYLPTEIYKSYPL